jgi:hypothetical protein
MTMTFAGLVPAVLLAGAAIAAEPTPEYADRAACMEGPIAQFGRYIGDWDIEDEQLDSDGTHWNPGSGARWIFRCIGDGTAVQDYWLPNKGGFGTNLRTYNPDTSSWEIVWTAKSLHGLTHITARQADDGSIVMNVLDPKPKPRRITFYPPTADGWHWKMEWSFDDGKTWTEVYRIKATPHETVPSS